MELQRNGSFKVKESSLMSARSKKKTQTTYISTYSTTPLAMRTLSDLLTLPYYPASCSSLSELPKNNELSNTRFFFYKNTLYKNIHDEIGKKVKNVLRILSS